MLPNYSINSRATKTGKSGIAVAVKNQTFQSVLDVTTSENRDILVTRISHGTTTFRIILGYGPQESADVDTRENFFTELEIEVSNSKMEGEIPLLLGDLNAKIEMGEENLKPVSANGKLLSNLIENQELQVLNFHEKCSGKWTHVIRTSGQKSVLDYAMISEGGIKYIKDIAIDESLLFCPFSTKKNKTN